MEKRNLDFSRINAFIGSLHEISAEVDILIATSLQRAFSYNKDISSNSLNNPFPIRKADSSTKLLNVRIDSADAYSKRWSEERDMLKKLSVHRRLIRYDPLDMSNVQPKVDCWNEGYLPRSHNGGRGKFNHALHNYDHIRGKVDSRLIRSSGVRSCSSTVPECEGSNSSSLVRKERLLIHGKEMMQKQLSPSQDILSKLLLPPG